MTEDKLLDNIIEEYGVVSANPGRRRDYALAYDFSKVFNPSNEIDRNRAHPFVDRNLLWQFDR